MPEIEFHWFSDPGAWAALATLTLLEIVLGIDNIVFISILVDRLPDKEQKPARLLGLGAAMFTRLLLLFSISWIMSLTTPLFHIPVAPALWKMMPSAAEHAGMLAISWKDIILIVGGGFLIFKSTHEIHDKIEHSEHGPEISKVTATFTAVIVQIAILDIIFSLDSVITAVGMADHITVMALAIIIAVAAMMVASGTVSRFVSDNPSIKMLALSFLIMIGMALLAEGFHFHIPKGYIYFAMIFSLGVELLNLKAKIRTADARAAE
jgi:predicted tellurium resistance membrane protein TerC